MDQKQTRRRFVSKGKMLLAGIFGPMAAVSLLHNESTVDEATERRAFFDSLLPTDERWVQAGIDAGLTYGKDFGYANDPDGFSTDEDRSLFSSLVDELSDLVAQEASAGCAWYNTSYWECRSYWQCMTQGGVRRYQQQAYYCSDRNTGPLAYRFVWTCCGCFC